MKICFIGLGSIGKKHIRNLTKILRQRDITFWIDALRVNNSLLEEDIQSLIQHIYQKFEELPSDYDIIFITNPTSMHYNTLLNIINKTKHVFVEKPVFAQQDVDLLALSPFKQGVNYVACPLRYHPITQFVREYIKGHQVFSVRSICSSYLREWRKGVDYRQVYSALKEQGGGVSLDLIHEWDYIKYLFGEPKSVFNMKGKCRIWKSAVMIYLFMLLDMKINL